MPVGIANLPNQRYKIVSRKGGLFTLMVVGCSGLGKSTFINTLFATLLKERGNQQPRQSKEIERTVSIDVVRADVEEKGFHVRLTIIDTPGFGDYMNNQECWVPIVEFLDDQHEQQLKREQQPQRDQNDDLRVHACLYFIQPTGHCLTALDIKAMKELGTRVNLIPVIAKGDTLTKDAILAFKQRILDAIRVHDIKIYTPPVEGDEEDEAPGIIEAIPFSIISSTQELSVKGKMVRGREYLWGVAEVENDDHCDFNKLRNMLIRTYMHDLISTTEDHHFESYRTQKLVKLGVTDQDASRFVSTDASTIMKKEEEELRKRFTEQVRLEEQRFRKWEQNLISERDRLNKDLESIHEEVKQLELEIESLSQ